MVRPLSLTLEAGGDGVVADLFFFKCVGEILVALDQILSLIHISVWWNGRHKGLKIRWVYLPAEP